jgi:DNA-binding CsgD family transcriptional regulator
MKLRWHLTEADEAAIRALTAAGKRQAEIVCALNIHRNTIYRYQKQLSLCLGRPGPRCPVLTTAQENKVVRLLRSGAGTGRIATMLGLREWSVRAVAKKNHFRHQPGRRGCRYEISEITRKKLEAEIRARQNFGVDLADKYPDVSYRVILKIARRVLGVPCFRTGRRREPLTSDFPQRHFRGELHHG